ncbi:Putative LOC100902024 [Caligus rogercresseyi]|uniref:LOC100902024 n=1 Tax=Caligus rogercresseyi TaxID=217165 RepID=A0A7T8QWN0_CALRO|nr:Putative LOC100902024 [Caligus rogercresseyi]
MPKVIDPIRLIHELGGNRVWVYDSQKESLCCRLCSKSFNIKIRSNLFHHVRSNKHQKHLDLFNKTQTIELEEQTSSVARPTFTMDLTRMMIACNIPLAKVEQPEFINFLEKHCGKRLPSRKTLTKCMEEECETICSKIKEQLKEKDIFVQADETTDSQGRAMTAIMAGTLNGVTLERPFLIGLSDVTTINNQSLQLAVIRALRKVLGSELANKKLRLFLTDGASYCLKAGRGLRQQFPNLIHVTCIAHALNRVADLARTQFPKVNHLISEIKNFFALRSFLQNSAAARTGDYCLERNFLNVKKFVEDLKNDSAAIIEAKEIFEDERSLLSLKSSKTTSQYLEASSGRELQINRRGPDHSHTAAFANKLKELLDKNPGYRTMMETASLLHSAKKYDANTFLMANAPMVTCDVERLFYILKDVNSPKRGRLTEAHLEDFIHSLECQTHLIISFHDHQGFFGSDV